MTDRKFTIYSGDETKSVDIVQDRNCWWWRHRWSRWTIYDQGNIRNDDKVKGTYITQQRECKCCGLLQTRTIKEMIA